LDVLDAGCRSAILPLGLRDHRGLRIKRRRADAMELIDMLKGALVWINAHEAAAVGFVAFFGSLVALWKARLEIAKAKLDIQKLQREKQQSDLLAQKLALEVEKLESDKERSRKADETAARIVKPADMLDMYRAGREWAEAGRRGSVDTDLQATRDGYFHQYRAGDNFNASRSVGGGCLSSIIKCVLWALFFLFVYLAYSYFSSRRH
jgi:hypothetical protein